jgi:hypothetical protein
LGRCPCLQSLDALLLIFTVRTSLPLEVLIFRIDRPHYVSLVVDVVFSTGTYSS